MLVNLSDVFSSEGKMVTETVELEMDSFKSRLGEFFITEKSPVTLILTNIGVGKARIEGSVELAFDTSCDRCLAEVPTILTLEFEREVASPDTAADSSEEEGDREDDELDFMEGYQLNVETFVYNEILMNWPMKILCKNDCKGICKVCGQNLNLSECGCDTFVPDPRMAAIQDIFNANKEV
ncbi:MAG: DUF177 domain-containing protein [Lachnospiraceae bacterium]|nr:DUF177 domain-containing protein [Lachnospiraceae bacterium]